MILVCRRNLFKAFGLTGGDPSRTNCYRIIPQKILNRRCYEYRNIGCSFAARQSLLLRQPLNVLIEPTAPTTRVMSNGSIGRHVNDWDSQPHYLSRSQCTVGEPVSGPSTGILQMRVSRLAQNFNHRQFRKLSKDASNRCTFRSSDL
jgi:hypothetical protein